MKTLESCQVRKEKKNKELGASLVEYGLLIALVALVAIPAVGVVGKNINTTFEDTKEHLASTSVNQDD